MRLLFLLFLYLVVLIVSRDSRNLNSVFLVDLSSKLAVMVKDREEIVSRRMSTHLSGGVSSPSPGNKKGIDSPSSE